MSTLAAPRSAAPSESTTPWAALPLSARLDLFGLAAAVGALVALLWPYWRSNADLSHGWLMPVIFFVLLHEARRGPARFLPNGVARGALLGLGAAALFALIAGGLYATAVGWTHSLVVFILTAAAVSLLAASLAAFAAEGVRFIPLNWTALAAVLLWLLCTPLPPGSYSRLTIGLQLAVSENVVRALHLLGIAADRHGNIIELATASVGVEEACSGVRSLISCVFAGVLFSATLVRSTAGRALIIAAAAPLAIAMNFLRSLVLTLLANSGVDIAGAWHDVTGFAVLGLTAVLLAATALLLERRSAPAARAAAGSTAVSRTALATPQWLAAVLGLTLAVAAFFAFSTRPSTHRDAPVPDLEQILPATAAGWRVATARDLYQFSSTLQTDHLAQRTYLRASPSGVDQITVYLAYWRAGQAPVSLVATHTPDACWPGSGWTSARAPHREVLTVARRPLAPAEARLFTGPEDFKQYVWFWHLYDGRPIDYLNPASPRELLQIAWRYGFTREGDQLFVRISSNHPWPEFADEPLVAELFRRLQPLGL